jgi:shikimate kinase
MAENIYLTGFMGSGKTTLAALLGQKIGMPWCDLDVLIQQNQKQTVQEIFQEYGESYFRELEFDTLIRIDSPMVVGLGGGAFMQPDIRTHIGLNGVSIYLDLNAGQIWERVRGKTRRPLVKSFGELMWLIEARRSMYASADFTFSVGGMESPRRVAEAVFDRLVSGGFRA